MLIVDAQIHLWSKGTTLPPHRAEPYLLQEALRDMEAAGVDRALIHPPSWDPDSNELAVEAVRAHPDRFAILGRFPSAPRAGRWCRSGSAARVCSACALLSFSRT